MADKKSNGTTGAPTGLADRATESVADAVRVATEASLAPAVKPQAPRRESQMVARTLAPKLAPPAYDIAPASLPAPMLADAFVPSPPRAEIAASTAVAAANSSPDTPAPHVSAVSREAAADPTTTHTSISINMEKVMTTAEEMMSFQQGNFEALMKSGQIWAAGLQDLGRNWAASAQAQIDETMGTVKAMTGVKSLREAVELQSTLARSSVEKAVSEGGKLTDASLKLAEQTIAPITARLTLAAERFGRTA